MENHKYDHLFKILLLGESGVGKTEFLLRFTDDNFISNHIGVDFKIKIIDLENKIIKLQIWDTAGEDRFHSIIQNYFKGCHGIILIYDVTNLNSFKNLSKFIKQIEENTDSKVKKVLVGNNCENPHRVIIEQEGKKYAVDNNMSFFEASYKTNKNVSEVFYHLTREILASYEHINKQGGIKISEINITKSEKKACVK